MATLRPLVIDDLSRLLELCPQAWEQYRSVLSPTEWQALESNVRNPATYLSLLQRGRGYGWCDENSVLQGVAWIIPSGIADDIYEQTWCQLRYVSVHPDLAGRGVGKGLVQGCIQDALDHAESTMALHTSEHMHRAQKIYEGLGFERVRELPRRFGMRYWLYTKTL